MLPGQNAKDKVWILKITVPSLVNLLAGSQFVGCKCCRDLGDCRAVSIMKAIEDLNLA